MLKKTETIDFRTFVKGDYKKVEPKKLVRLNSFIPAISPTALFDWKFIVVGGAVVVVAIIENALADSGYYTIAESMSNIFGFIFPIAGFTAVWYLITQSANLLL